MKLATLILNCVKETFRNSDSSLTEEAIASGDALLNENYSDELNNALLSINKGIGRLTQTEKIKFREIDIPTNVNTFKYDLKQFEEDHVGIKNIKGVYYLVNGHQITTPFKQIGNSLIIERPMTDTLIVVYTPLIRTLIDMDIRNNIELNDYGIDDEMCSILTYFAKSEMYESSDPDRCKRYLNYFESYLNDFKNDQSIPMQASVYAKYGIER